MIHSATLGRSFGERLRVAIVTLWLPIVVLAFVPFLMVHPIAFTICAAIVVSERIILRVQRHRIGGLIAKRHIYASEKQPQRLDV